MSEFMVISPHTKDECLSMLDSIAEKGNDTLGKWEFSCMAGDHTGYELIKADSSSDALREVPDLVRSKARAVEVKSFTKEQIKSLHSHN